MPACRHDEQARSLARQLLPRHAKEAVPKLMPLLGQENAAVREAAFRVLADIANEASAPGREADRAAMTDSLMTLVSSAQPLAMRLLGLRLLPIVIPPDHDVGPIAALLDEPALREKAREALEETATPACRGAFEVTSPGPNRISASPSSSRWAGSAIGKVSRRSPRWPEASTRGSAPRPRGPWRGRAIRPTFSP